MPGSGQFRWLKVREDRGGNDRSQGTADVPRRPRAVTKSRQRSFINSRRLQASKAVRKSARQRIEVALPTHRRSRGANFIAPKLSFIAGWSELLPLPDVVYRMGRPQRGRRCVVLKTKDSRCESGRVLIPAACLNRQMAAMRRRSGTWFQSGRTPMRSAESECSSAMGLPDQEGWRAGPAPLCRPSHCECAKG